MDLLIDEDFHSAPAGVVGPQTGGGGGGGGGGHQAGEDGAPEAPAEYDSYGFRIDSTDSKRAERERYYARYEARIAEQKGRWQSWTADNALKAYPSWRHSGAAGDDSQLARMAQKGIPREMRGEMWRVISGARFKQNEKANSGGASYEALKRKSGALDAGSEAAISVEKDLHRTFPGHEKFATADGIDALRNVLLAYAVRNPSIGYCQSMNYIVALLLLFMDEDHAFWQLTTMVEEVLPTGFYTDDMSSLLGDLDVFIELVRIKLPKVSEHFAALNIDLGAICSQWFLLAFVNVLPLETTLRVWDCLLLEGFVVLFRVSLAILRYNEGTLLGTTETGEGIEQLAGAPANAVRCNHLLKLSFDDGWLGRDFDELVHETRMRYHAGAEPELRRRPQSGSARDLLESATQSFFGTLTSALGGTPRPEERSPAPVHEPEADEPDPLSKYAPVEAAEQRKRRASRETHDYEEVSHADEEMLNRRRSMSVPRNWTVDGPRWAAGLPLAASPKLAHVVSSPLDDDAEEALFAGDPRFAGRVESFGALLKQSHDATPAAQPKFEGQEDGKTMLDWLIEDHCT